MKKRERVKTSLFLWESLQKVLDAVHTKNLFHEPLSSPFLLYREDSFKRLFINEILVREFVWRNHRNVPLKREFAHSFGPLIKPNKCQVEPIILRIVRMLAHFLIQPCCDAEANIQRCENCLMIRGVCRPRADTFLRMGRDPVERA